MTTRRMLAINHASTRFEATRDLLIAALDRHDSRSCLDAFVELATLHLEQTGGTLVTARYRQELATLRARVEIEPVLRALPDLPAPKKETYDMTTDDLDAPIEYWHDDARLAHEFKRQAGWVQTVTDKGIWFAPRILAAE